MKRIKWLGLLLAMCMMCTACGTKIGTEGPAGTVGGTVEAPETEVPGTEELTTEEPTTEAPMTEDPTTEEPTPEETTTEEPTTEEPTTEEQPTEPVNLHTEETQVAGEGIVQIFETGKTLVADLDGDGITERITVAVGQGYHPLSMQIDDVYWNADEFSEAVRYMENPECQKFYLVDVDVSDGWKELAFYEHGPSGDPCTTFLRYQNGELVYIGEIADGAPGEGRYGSVTMEFPGDGTISAVVRYWEFQTDSTKKMWKLANGSELNASLEEVVPEYYEFVRNSGWQFNIQLVQNATFYREMNADMENVIMLPEGTRVDLARYYPETGWLEVVYEGGEKSVWLQVTAEKMFMPMNVDIYKYFTGLNAAG